MLSCSCPESDDLEGDFYYPAEAFSKLKITRRKRCCSCKKLIDLGSDVLVFLRFRYPRTEIEERIYGCDDAEIPMASWYMCEECGEIYLNLSDVGYCLDPEIEMKDYLKNYWELTEFEPKNSKDSNEI